MEAGTVGGQVDVGNDIPDKSPPRATESVSQLFRACVSFCPTGQLRYYRSPGMSQSSGRSHKSTLGKYGLGLQPAVSSVNWTLLEREKV